FLIRWAGTGRHLTAMTLLPGSCMGIFIHRYYAARAYANLWWAMKCWLNLSATFPPSKRQNACVNKALFTFDRGSSFVQSLTPTVLKNLFSAKFQQSPEVVVQAPGRVNLIGEHTDYNDGFVLPAAINYQTWIAATARDDRELHIVAHNFADETISFNLDAVMQQDPAMPWSNYVCGVVQQLRKNNYQLRGGNLFIVGNVP